MITLADLYQGVVGITGDDRLEMLAIAGHKFTGDPIKDLNIPKYEDLTEDVRKNLSLQNAKDFSFKPFDSWEEIELAKKEKRYPFDKEKRN